MDEYVNSISWQRWSSEREADEHEEWDAPNRLRVTYEGNRPEEPTTSRAIYAVLRTDPLMPVGWTLQLGTANPQREVGLVEVLALTDRGENPLVQKMVEDHLELIEVVTGQIVAGGLRSQMTISRDRADHVVRLLRDLIRLRREVFHARMATPYATQIEAQLERAEAKFLK